jgi:hypothetical protein
MEAKHGKLWAINGIRHREDGPAVEFTNGDKQWYVKGVRMTEEEFKQITKKS